METGRNNRGYRKTFFKGKHLKLTELKEELRLIGIGNHKYLSKLDGSCGYDIPPYPQPEFHVSHLIHDTNDPLAIPQNDPGESHTPSYAENAEKQYPKNAEFLWWWSLSVRPEDMQSAEKRFLDHTFPDRTDEQAARQEPFLQQFATSPAFLDTSRYGAFRLNFPLQELLEEYRKQVCDGSEPVLRVHETVIYRQEVQYSVLVHCDKHNNVFEKYPLLDDSPDAVCAYKDGHIIWRPEAMCGTHGCELVHTADKQLVVIPPRSAEFYVWDHVALAFYLPGAQTLNLDTNRMRCNLTFCDPGYPTVSREEFYDYEKANELVKEHWPGHGPLSKVHK